MPPARARTPSPLPRGRATGQRALSSSGLAHDGVRARGESWRRAAVTSAPFSVVIVQMEPLALPRRPLTAVPVMASSLITSGMTSPWLHSTTSVLARVIMSASVRRSSAPSARTGCGSTSTPSWRASGSTVCTQRGKGLESTRVTPLSPRRSAMRWACLRPSSLRPRTSSADEYGLRLPASACRTRYRVTARVSESRARQSKSVRPPVAHAKSPVPPPRGTGGAHPDDREGRDVDGHR